MIIRLKPEISNAEYCDILKYFHDNHLEVKDISSANTKVIAIIGDTTNIIEQDLYAFEGVMRVSRIQEQYKKVNKKTPDAKTIIEVGPYKIGEGTFTIMAGPCSVEGQKEIMNIAKLVKDGGAHILRGGVFKPRTSPFAFQGLGIKGLEYLVAAKNQYHMPIISEIPSEEYIDEFVKKVDIIQVGARNMQNFSLLKALGKVDKPIMLKRGLSATIEEWLLAAEYILQGGNSKVILCERGIRTFEHYTRNTLDLSAVLAVKQLSHLPVVVDPSHACGRYDMVENLSLAALAVGADGIIVEVHDNPACALSDGAQSLKPERFKEMVKKLKELAPILNKEII